MIGYLIQDGRLRAAYATTILLTILLIVCVLVYPDLLNSTWRIIVPAIPGIMFAILVLVGDHLFSTNRGNFGISLVSRIPGSDDVARTQLAKADRAREVENAVYEASRANQVRQENDAILADDFGENQGHIGRIYDLEYENKNLRVELARGR